MLDLHPKIMAALLAAVAVAVVAVGNAAAEVYPQWANIILVFAPVIAGYLKAAEPA